MLSVHNENTEENKVLKNLVIGIQAIEKDLRDALEKNGITRFDALDQKFDPEIHQAVSKVHSEKPDSIIVEELQKGFMIGDRLLRAAMVVVSMGPEKKIKSYFENLLSVTLILPFIYKGDKSIFFFFLKGNFFSYNF